MGLQLLTDAASPEPWAERTRAELFRTALDGVWDSLSLIDPAAMRFVDFNAATCRITGMSADELQRLGPAVAGHMPAAELRAKYQEVIEQFPDVVVEEQEFAHPDGTDRLLEFARSAARVDGRWLITVVARDITELKRSRARLERFASALDLSADALFLVDRRTLTYLDFNQSACRLLGLSRAELMARSPNQTSPSLGTLDDLAALYDQVIGRAPQVVMEEILVTRADGRQVPCEVHRQGLYSQGRWVIVANLRDISDRKQQQARIERFASVVNMSEDAVLLIERESMRILDVNEAACRLYRFERPELLQLPLRRTMRQRKPDSDLEQQFDSLIAISPQVVRTERIQVRSDGTTFPAETQRQAILSDGKWIIVNTVRDVTERHRAQQELARRVTELTRSNEELAEYAYAISHDLSEPLRTVTGFTQLLERRYGHQLDGTARDFMGYMVSGAQRMRQLIDDLLRYARSGREFAITPAPVAALLDDAVANLSSAIAGAGAEVERGPMPEFECDKSMAQVFQNLIGNALKFRGEAAPRIRVEGVEQRDAWVVSVHDNGIGIDPEHFGRIFVLFQRLHPRDTYDGTGIGLAICKKIVERLGGSIAVESRPGEGTKFSVRLPKVPQAADAP